MPNQKAWMAVPSGKKTKSQRNPKTYLDPPINTTDPCDGGDAAELFRIHGSAAAAIIAARVANFGTKHQKSRKS